MSEMSFEQMLDESFKTIHNGEVVEGTVIDVKDDEIINNELLETVLGEEINIFNITNSFTSYSFKLKTGCMKELRKDINIKANNYIKVLLAKSNLLSYIYLKVRFG